MVCNGDCLRFLPYKWRNDKRIVAEALRRSGKRLRWASARLRADPSVVKMALDSDPSGYCLRFASASLRKCSSLGLYAVRANGGAILHLDPVLLKDAHIVCQASLTFPALPLAHVSVRNNLELVTSIWQSCEQTLIGPNLSVLPFLEQNDLLETVAEHLEEDDVFLCRVRLLSGRTTLTSFPRDLLGGCRLAMGLSWSCSLVSGGA